MPYPSPTLLPSPSLLPAGPVGLSADYVDYAGALTLSLDAVDRTLDLDAGPNRTLLLDERGKTLTLTETSRTLEVDT